MPGSHALREPEAPPWDMSGEPTPGAAGGQPAGEDIRSAPGVGVRWVFTSPTVAVTRWRCCNGNEDDRGAEKYQPWHVIGFIHGGSFLMHLPGGRAVADPNCLLFFNPGAPYRTSHPFGCGDRGSSIVVRPDVLGGMLASLDPAAGEREEPRFPADRGAGAPAVFLGQVRLVERLARAGGPGDPLAVEQRVLDLAAAAVAGLYGDGRRGRAAVREATESFHRERVEAAREVMQRRMREPLRLDDVARAVHLSPCHLARVFRRVTGLPVHRYLNRLRLRAALEAASEGAPDLSALALALGFSSHSHFTAAFRREFGTTPSASRRLPAALASLSEPVAPLARV